MKLSTQTARTIKLPGAAFRSFDLLLHGTCTAQQSEHAVVAFMACVLINRKVALPHWNLDGERLGPGRLIIHRVLIEKFTWADAREALGEPHRRAGVAEGSLVVEVDGFNDQRVAFPMAARTAGPLRDA